MTTQQLRDRIALLIAAAAVLAGVASAALGSYQTGIYWRVDSGRLVVDWVEPHSQADRDGVRSGLIALSLNGDQLLALPSFVYSDLPSATDPPPIVGTAPSTPTPLRAPADLESLARTPVEWVEFITPEALAVGGPDTWQSNGFTYPGTHDFRNAQLGLLPGIFVLAGGLWWLRSARVGAALRDLAIPLVVAVAVPLVVAPLDAIGTFSAVLFANVLTVIGVVPLAIGLADLIRDPDDRRLILIGVSALTLGALIAAVGVAVGNTDDIGLLFLVLTTGIALVPGVVAAGPIDLGRLRTSASVGAGGLVQSTELALAGATPFFGIASAGNPYPWPLILWLLAIFAAARFTVRPLARLATRATLQRDLVVAATEAERARLAADIHDDALQELTLLVRRLEASGDTEGAEIGRTVADRLRAICGDLRLPILDDLGVGPALDWLVLRIERLAGGEVRLERSEDARHSPDVELAIFRVAQEALANAVKHGSPPIVVRYRSTPAGISLAIDDAGPGIADEAPADAERAGRFGLLNMAQRAEQIGAILDVKRWPTGGTHVALEWRPR